MFFKRQNSNGEIKRSSTIGEFLALKKWAAKNQWAFELDLLQFAAAASKPCYRCEGRTPGYEVNTLRQLIEGNGYKPDNITPVCWDCIRDLANASEAEKEALSKKEKIQKPIDELLKMPLVLKKVTAKYNLDRAMFRRARLKLSIGRDAYFEVCAKKCIKCKQYGRRLDKLETDVYWCMAVMKTPHLGFTKDNLEPYCRTCLDEELPTDPYKHSVRYASGALRGAELRAEQEAEDEL